MLNIPSRPLTPQKGRGSVFGGLLLAQAMMSASSTLGQDFYPYISQYSFIRPVTKSKLMYHVERIADGRNFATRLVRASLGRRDAEVMFVGAISFQSLKMPAGNGLSYAVLPPDLDGLQPEDLSEGNQRELIDENRSGSLQPFKPEEEPFDWRGARIVLTDNPTDFRATVRVASSDQCRYQQALSRFT